MKFSIVMPMYKQSERVISRAIHSIIDQTYTDWELVICDNGNDDVNVINLINSLMKEDKRIIYFKSEKNVGWPKGISLCLEKASGDFFGFIADDDYLENCALERVYKEIRKFNPDVVWLGQKYDILENGNFKTINEEIPPYMVMEGKSQTCENLIKFFNNVYYNSMQHYVRIDLLNKYGINFYDKYISDCGGMTKVLSVAEKMVVLNEAFYHLTQNTSLTRGRYQMGFYNMFASQWTSVIELLENEKYYDKNVLIYLAKRFERNHLGNIDLLCNEAPCRTDLYENIQLSYKERFCELEKTLSNESICEMIDFYGREDYFYIIVTNLINLLQNAYNNGEILNEVISDSSYLGDFVLGLFEVENGIVNIAKSLTITRIIKIIKSLMHIDNVGLFGYELLMKVANKASDRIEDIIGIIKLKQKCKQRKERLSIKFNNMYIDSSSEKLISFVCLYNNIKENIKEFIDYLIQENIDINEVELLIVNNSENENIYHYIVESENKYPESIGIINLEKRIEESEAIGIGISYASANYIGVINSYDWTKLKII